MTLEAMTEVGPVLKFSTVANVKATTLIQRHESTWSGLVAKLREPEERPSKDACALLKLVTFGEKRNKNGSLRHDDNVAEVFGLVGDYDGEKVTPAQAAELLRAAEVRALIYTSASHMTVTAKSNGGPRWRVVAPLSEAVPPAENWRLMSTLNGVLGGILAAPESWTLSQVYYYGRVAGVPYEFHEVEGTPLDLLELYAELPGPIGPETREKVERLPIISTKSPELIVKEVAEVVQRVAADSRLAKLWAGDMSDCKKKDNGMPDHSAADFALCNGLARYTDDPVVIDQAFRQSGLMRDKWKRTDYREWTIGRALKGPSAVATAEDFEDHTADTGTPAIWVPDLKRDKQDRIESSMSNLVGLLSWQEGTPAPVAFDSFKDEIMIAHGDQMRPLQDDDLTRLQAVLEDWGFRSVPRENLRHAVQAAAAAHKYDSATDWLIGLPWDGVPRVERFLPDYFSTEDSPYTRAVSKYLWTALAGRVLDPGCQCDMVPILVGDQGVRKTTSLRALVVSPDHFTEISLNDRDDNLSRKMRGRLAGEIGELRGLHSRELEDIKSFITRTHETWTPKYREFATSYARRIVLVGTTNSEEFLADPTGNRRWLPVKVGNVDVPPIEADRLQLWAEGSVMWLVDGIAWQAAQKLAPEYHAQHVVTDSWEELIAEWLDDCDWTGKGNNYSVRERPFTSAEALIHGIGLLKGQINRAHEQRLARVLKTMGFRQERRRVGTGGSRLRQWVADKPVAGSE